MNPLTLAEGILNHFPSQSTYPKIILGATAGCITGYTTMKLGKLAAFAIGGGIIMMQLANQEGYITIDWFVVSKKLHEAGEAKVNADNEKEQTETSPADGTKDDKQAKNGAGADEQPEAEKKGKKEHAVNWAKKLLDNSSAFYGAYIAGVALGVGMA